MISFFFVSFSSGEFIVSYPFAFLNPRVDLVFIRSNPRVDFKDNVSTLAN